MAEFNKLNLEKLKRLARPHKKARVLVWSDCVTSTTGFAVVSKHICKALQATGLYDIDQLAINFFDDFYDRTEYPYNIIPARLNNPRDPYGNQMFIDALQRHAYDLVFIINDTFVVESVAKNIDAVKSVKLTQKQPIPKIIYYYPVDCKLRPEYSTMVKIADRAVAYTNFAKRSSEEIGVIPTDVIYHGVDTKSFFPLAEEHRQRYRKVLMNVNPDTFVIINVNRNSVRKNLAATIYAFSQFRKIVPNSILYLHAKVQDGTGSVITDLSIPVKDLGFNTKQDVIFPANYDAARGFPTDTLNALYNCGDMFLTTHRGEGFGLSVGESMATGVPVVAPRSTSMPEILGEKEERGFMYDCREMVYVDASGYRPDGRIEDIVNKMLECYRSIKDGSIEGKKKRAREFAQKFSWENVCKDWVKLFDQTLRSPTRHPANNPAEVL